MSLKSTWRRLSLSWRRWRLTSQDTTRRSQKLCKATLASQTSSLITRTTTCSSIRIRTLTIWSLLWLSIRDSTINWSRLSPLRRIHLQTCIVGSRASPTTCMLSMQLLTQEKRQLKPSRTWRRRSHRPSLTLRTWLKARRLWTLFSRAQTTSTQWIPKLRLTSVT